MIALLGNQFVLLAESDWSRLIGVIVIFGFWVISALAKMWANRSSDGDDEANEKTSQLIELAKKYAKQRQTQSQQRRPVRNNEFTSEWDRRQEMKRQRQAQLHERRNQSPKPVKIPAVPAIPKPARQVPAENVPDFKPVGSQLDRIRQYAQQLNIQKQPPRPISAPRTHKAAGKKHATAHKKSAAAPTTTTFSHPLHVLLGYPDQLRSAIVLKEILDKPIALREDW
jgi:hypothetical protein